MTRGKRLLSPNTTVQWDIFMEFGHLCQRKDMLDWLQITRCLAIKSVILGAIVPYVLRRAGEEGFELAGEAYVHRIMDGEAMALGLKEEHFCFL